MPFLVDIFKAEWDLDFEEKIIFDDSLESWSIFLIEMTGILIQRGLL